LPKRLLQISRYKTYSIALDTIVASPATVMEVLVEEVKDVLGMGKFGGTRVFVDIVNAVAFFIESGIYVLDADGAVLMVGQ